MPTYTISPVFKNIEYIPDNNQVCKKFTTLKKFKNELEFLQYVQHLESVIKLIDYDIRSKNIILEYISISLDNIIKLKQLKSDEKIDIMKQICKYIIDSHELGIVHNDLKSKNILLTEDYKIKVIDYDLATWNTNPARDIKQFKFLIIQLLFDIDYVQSYKNFDMYVNNVHEPLRDIFTTNDIYEIDKILESISV